MRDISIREIGAAAVADRMAGNFVLLDHGNGWVTQYGHLRRGSVRVKPGDRVAAGQRLGLIGLSGHTEFPHVHFEVRHHGTPVDPFTGTSAEAGCGTTLTQLWSPAAGERLAYQPTALLSSGFATEKPTGERARKGLYAAAALPTDSPAVVFWVDVFGVQPGDVQELRVYAPDGTLMAEKIDAEDSALAQAFRAVGQARQGAPWTAGRYRGVYRLVRGGTALLGFAREIPVGLPAVQTAGATTAP
jgi:hypothetical protein